MAEWRKQRESGQKPDEIARLRFAASAMSARAADLQKIADAADPLYKTLDEGQKHRLQILLGRTCRTVRRASIAVRSAARSAADAKAPQRRPLPLRRIRRARLRTGRDCVHERPSCPA